MITNNAFKMLIFVLLIVFLNILSAIILKEVSMHFGYDFLLIVGVSILVLILNLAKYVLWAHIHKHYSISRTLPITSIFYPLIFLVSLYYGENFNLNKILGCILIIIGIKLILDEESKSGLNRF